MSINQIISIFKLNMPINGVDKDIKSKFKLFIDLENLSLYEPIYIGLRKNDLYYPERELLEQNHNAIHDLNNFFRIIVGNTMDQFNRINDE